MHCRLAAQVAFQDPAEPCPAKACGSANFAGRCNHRPLCRGGLPSLFHRPFALHCRAGVHARRRSLRRMEHFGFAQTLSRKALRYRKPQAAGEIARPTKSPQAGGDTQTSADRQARRRADANHRPLCRGGLPSSLRRPCAPHCRAGVHARRGSLRRVEHFGFAQTLPRKALRCHKPQAAGENARPTKPPEPGGGLRKRQPLPDPPAGRKGTCKARRRTPPSLAAAPPLTGEALWTTAA